MHLQMILFVLVACTDSDSAHSPFGVKMCKLLCQQTGNCTVFRFSQVQLICSLENSTATGDIFLYRFPKEHQPFCPSQSRQVLSREGHNMCINYIQKSVDKDQGMRLFYTPANLIVKNKPCILDLQTGSKSYPKTESKGVSSIAYLSSMKKVVVIRHNSQIELWNLTSGSSEVLIKYNNARRIAVDDDQLLVLFTRYGKENFSVNSVHAVSREKTVIIERSNDFSTRDFIVVDASKKLFYISDIENIMAVSYVENKIQTVYRKHLGINAFGLSGNGNYLYYTVGIGWDMIDFIQFSLESRRKKQLLTLPRKPKTIIVYKGKYIISFINFDRIYSLDFEQNTTEVLANFTQNTMDICLID